MECVPLCVTAHEEEVEDREITSAAITQSQLLERKQSSSLWVCIDSWLCCKCMSEFAKGKLYFSIRKFISPTLYDRVAAWPTMCTYLSHKLLFYSWYGLCYHEHSKLSNTLYKRHSCSEPALKWTAISVTITATAAALGTDCLVSSEDRDRAWLTRCDVAD